MTTNHGAATLSRLRRRTNPGVSLVARRIPVVLGVPVLVVSMVLAGAAGPVGAATVHGGTTVRIETTGQSPVRVLVDQRGRTLYVDIHDHGRHLDCTGSCARQWPPLLVAKGKKRAGAGPGVHNLGTVPRPDHRLQVTFDKMPLYLYAGDVRSGQAHGQGVRGAFFVATPTGALRPAAEPAAAPTTLPSPPVTAPPATAPPATSPPATIPPATSPPATSPPATRPPVTSPPPTSPPTTTAPVGGGVAY